MRLAMGSLLARAKRMFQRVPPPPGSAPVRIVGLLADARDRELLTRAAARHQWDVTFADTYPEAHQLLEKIRAPVVLCDRDLLDPDWGSMVRGLAACSHRACILLVSKVADDYLWNEVIRRGGCDILSKPLHEDEVVRAVKLAWSYWNLAASPSTR